MKFKNLVKSLLLILILLIANNKVSINDIINVWNQFDNSIDNIVDEFKYNTDSYDYYSEYNIPEFNGTGVIVLNNNVPYFSKVNNEYYLSLSSLDNLGRCGEANALVGPDTLATTERSSISSIYPSGWHLIRYDDYIADKYLYNRSHLIMYALYGEETNVKENLITGTRYFNATEMLSYETKIVNYIESTGNNVEYHVIPVYKDNELIARGVIMQALSEDGDFKFNVFCYNVQPSIEIDYLTGESWINEEIAVN